MTNEYTLDRLDMTRSAAPAAIEITAVAGALALGALARFPLPGTPVPVTLQVLPVLLAPFAVGRFRATAGVVLYLSLGFAGVPLFAASAGMGVTLGYLLGFMLVPAVATRFKNPALGILASLGIIYALGVTWLCLWLHVSPVQGVLLGVVPFMPGALLKAVAAYKLIPYVRG